MPFLRKMLPASACGLLLPLCMFFVKPYVASGMNDDWAYMQVAQRLEVTGHIHYNGWTAPMLGWQLYWGDLFLHIFRDPFLALRLSTVVISCLLGIVVYLIFRRAGLSSANAVVGTTMLLTSPLFLPIAFSYMSDVFGLFALIACFACCLCAMQAGSDRGALGWFVAAAALDAVGGTARQVSWLGVLVLCPITLWSLRHRAAVLKYGGLALIAAWLFVLYSVHWFRQQPFTLGVGFTPKARGSAFLVLCLYLTEATILTLPLLCLPALLPFLRRLSRMQWLVLLLGGGATSAVYIGACIVFHKRGFLGLIYAPYLGNYVTQFGSVSGTPIHGQRPVVLNHAVGLLLTAVSLGSTYAACCAYRFRRSVSAALHRSDVSRWTALNRLSIPLAIIYGVCLIPRLFTDEFFDRYLLIFLFLAILYLLKLYQDFVSHGTSSLAWAGTVLFAAYGIACTHDVFAFYRARVQAIDEVQQAGIAPAAIDGGFEYNGSTQLALRHYILGPHLRGAPVTSFPADPRPLECQTYLNRLYPVIHSDYALSFNPELCGGKAQFAPVQYKQWLGPRTVAIYVIRVAQLTGATAVSAE